MRPSIGTPTVLGAAVIMMLSRLGSLNALEQHGESAFWSRWLGQPLPSADTMGRVFERMDLVPLRAMIRHAYSTLKRNKALQEIHGVNALVIDGHESSSSYLRSCSGCLKRKIRSGDAEREQFYHRQVLAMLACKSFPVLLDAEEQRQREDEVACAMRLCRRVLENYPRAFDLVIVDALYQRSDFFEFLLDRGKDVLCVLKDERRDLVGDARGLFKGMAPVVTRDGAVERSLWDVEGLTSWEGLGRPVRVVRSVEVKRVVRQRTGEEEVTTSEWMWVTTLPKWKVPTEAVVRLGHARWLVENQAFNEMVNHWHADHVYRHHPTAITAFWLALMLVLNLFRAFVNLNIKPSLRAGHTILYFARLLFQGLNEDWRVEKPP